MHDSLPEGETIAYHGGTTGLIAPAVEPARYLVDAMARAGQPTWLYRFSCVPQSQRNKLRGTPHGLEIPYTFGIPAAIIGGSVTAADVAMADLTSAYWVTFSKTGNPNGGGRPQ